MWKCSSLFFERTPSMGVRRNRRWSQAVYLALLPPITSRMCRSARCGVWMAGLGRSLPGAGDVFQHDGGPPRRLRAKLPAHSLGLLTNCQSKGGCYAFRKESGGGILSNVSLVSVCVVRWILQPIPQSRQSLDSWVLALAFELPQTSSPWHWPSAIFGVPF